MSLCVLMFSICVIVLIVCVRLRVSISVRECLLVSLTACVLKCVIALDVYVSFYVPAFYCVSVSFLQLVFLKYSLRDCI